MIRSLFCVFMLFCLQIHAAISWHGNAPDGFSVDVSIPKTEVSLGDSIDIHMSLMFPLDYTFDLEGLKASLVSHSPFKAPPFELISAETDSETNDHNITETIHFILKSQLEGTFLITFHSIGFKPHAADGKPVQILSDLFEIKVNALPSDPKLPVLHTQDLLSLSLTPPIEMDMNNRGNLINNLSREKLEAERNQKVASESAFPWLAIIVGLLAILLLIFYWLAPPSKPLPKVLQQRQLLAREKAMISIEHLQEEQAEASKYCVDLTDTLRNYIEEQYLIRAPTYTTQEFLQEATRHPGLSPEMRDELRQFLINADKIKFAKHTPTEKEREEAKASAIKVIEA